MAVARVALDLLLGREAADGTPRYDRDEALDAVLARLDPARIRDTSRSEPTGPPR